MKEERPRHSLQTTNLAFDGLNVEEAADVLPVLPANRMREWSAATAWLYGELVGGTRDGR
jgi:hypothetical protein